MNGAFLRLVEVTKRYGNRTVVDRVSLDVAKREIMALLGPSGCGKATTLRLIAGLEAPDEGEIWIAGERVAAQGRNLVPPSQRGIGFVFQDLALWPHLTVAGNLDFVLASGGVPKRERETRITEALKMVRIEPLAHNYPRQLSGGEQQLAALARALVGRPRLLLLDEPRSSLDADLKADLLREFAARQRLLGVTTIYITHDRTEAAAVAHRAALMRAGHIRQVVTAEGLREQFTSETGLPIIQTGCGAGLLRQVSFRKAMVMFGRKMISVTLAATALVLVLSACERRESDSDEAKRAPAPPSNAPTPVETAAPMQPPGKTLTYNFDHVEAGALPSTFSSTRTGGGTIGSWEVRADETAPSKPNVLAQTSDDSTDYRFPMAVANEGAFKDLELSVKFKTVAGSIDQAGGLVFRYRDANNYYIVRANALENNYRLYRVVNGNRQQFAGANLTITPKQWHELKVVCVGDQITCFFDGEQKIQAADQTFKEAGKVGVWTKADSVTYFDDLTVVAK